MTNTNPSFNEILAEMEAERQKALQSTIERGNQLPNRWSATIEQLSVLNIQAHESVEELEALIPEYQM